MIFYPKIIPYKYLLMSNQKSKVTIPKPSRQVESSGMILPKPTPLITNIETKPQKVFSVEMINDVETFSKEDFAAFLNFLAEAYYNAEELVSNDKYDSLIKLYEGKYGPYTAVAAVPRGTKVDLP